MPLPSDLQNALDQIDAADRAGDAIAGRVTDEQFHWKPDGRRWSIGECLDHLALINTMYIAAVRTGVDKARANGWTRRRPGAVTFFARSFIAWLEPPVKTKGRAREDVVPRPMRGRD